MLNRIKNWDDKVLTVINKKHTPKLNKLMILITTMGNNGYVWFAFALPFLFMNKWRLTGFTILFSMGISWFGAEIAIKHIVGRIRPCYKTFKNNELLIKNPSQYSFPSGHTATSFAVATVVMVLFPVGFIPTLILACLIGFSRMYLLVHYPTDVLAGIIFGILCGIIAIPVSECIPIFNFQI